MFTPSAPSVDEIAARLGLRKSGARWVGRCPECGGSAETNRFTMKEDGRFYCFSCQIGGGRLAWLRKFEKMPCKAAHLAAGVNCEPSCPRYADCYKNGLKGQMRRKKSLSPEPPQAQSEQAGLKIHEYRAPDDRWRHFVAEHLSGHTVAVKTQQAAVEWLSRRGISTDAAARFGLRWQNRDRNAPLKALGLPQGPGEKPTVWIPGGLVIPTGYMGGPVLRVRTRRTEEARERFGKDKKYVFLKGCWTGPVTFNMGAAVDVQPDVLVVVESELDGIAIASACPDVGVIALGTVRQPLTPELDRLCREARWVLVALDADEINDKGQRPGVDQARLWLQTYDRAKFCPVPYGKDPGEFCERGGNLAEWIDSALAPAKRSRAQNAAPEKAPKTPPPAPASFARPHENDPAPDFAAPARELVALLEQERGFVVLDGRDIYARYADRKGAINPARGRVSAILYTDAALWPYLESLARIYRCSRKQPGRFGPGSLREYFFG